MGGPRLCVLSPFGGSNISATQPLHVPIVLVHAVHEQDFLDSIFALCICTDASDVGEVQDLLDLFLQSPRPIASDVGCTSVWFSGLLLLMFTIKSCYAIF